MEIIVLEGAKTCGKTSTLGMLYAYMANNASATPQISTPPIEIPKTPKKDFAVTLEYTGKQLGRKKIAIYTAGDTKSMTEDGIIYACTKKADILITANSTGKPSQGLFAPHTVNQVVKPHVVTKTLTTLPVNAVSTITQSFYADCLAANMQTAKGIEALL